MTEDLGNKPHGVSRLLSKDRWRFGSKHASASHEAAAEPPDRDEAAKNFTLNDDVVDFLKPSTSRARPVSPKAPKIDIAAAQEWASKPDANGLSTPSSLVKKNYPRRKLNLAVGFVRSPPEVIGAGGDESESPVAEISRRRRERGGQPEYLGSEELVGERYGDAVAGYTDVTPSAQVPAPDAQHTPRSNDFASSNRGWVSPNPHVSVNAESNEDDFVPKPLQRQQTSFHTDEEEVGIRPSFDSEHSSEPSSAGPNAREGRRQAWQLPEFDSIVDNSPIDVTNRIGHLHMKERKDSESSVYNEKIHQMRAEEGKALHEAAHHPMPDFGPARLSDSTASSFQAQSPVEAPTSTFSGMQSQNMSAQRPPNPNNLASQPLQVQQYQGSHEPTPSPSNGFHAVEVPSHEPQPQLSMRKPVPLAAAPLVPFAQESPQKTSPRPSPLPLYIPRQEQFSGSPRTSMDQPAGHSGYRDQEQNSAASSNPKTPYTPYTPPPQQQGGNSIPSANTQAAVEDFAERCSHMGGIFRLQAEFERPIIEFTPMQWVRACAWWFLRGRLGIEALVRGLPRRSDGRPEEWQGEQRLAQPHVDLAKAYWILTDVIINHPGLRPSNALRLGQRAVEARNAGDMAAIEVLESADLLMVNLEAVLGSMRRNNVMPPTNALIQGQDQTVWVRYPTLAPNLLPILSGNMSRSLTDSGNIQKFNPLSVMAVQDTKSDFSYNRMFVPASLGTDDENVERISLSCLVSVMRERNDWHPKVAICTQRELLTICIQGDRKRGPSWSDVQWNSQTSTIHVRIPHGYNLDVQFTEADFRQLYNMYNQAYRVQSSLLPLSNERVIYEVHLLDFQYTDSRKPPAFPPDRVKRCRIRMFEKTEVRTEVHGQRKLYRGFRLLAVTSPKNRILGSASHDMGTRYPVNLEVTSDPSNQGASTIRLLVQEDRRQCNLFMVLQSPDDCTELSNALRSMEMNSDESQFASLPLKHISIQQLDQIEANSPASRNPLMYMKWQMLSVVNKDPENPDHDVGQTINSSSLRIQAIAIEGTWTDRMNLGPGELRIRLPIDGQPSLSIFRPPQDDLSMSLNTADMDPNLASDLSDVQRTVYAHPTIRTYAFFSLTDLHCFQTAVTGFVTKYDGLASAFTIARRRPMTALSKHRKLEASTTRIQVVAHEHMRVVQLLAFFDDFPGTDSLNFHLKGVDIFERHDSKHSHGRYGVKLVDAKFTLPKMDKEEKRASVDGKGAGSKTVERAFVSLDMPEVPAENDDIVVGFDDEGERERFIAALPAPAQVARGMTLKRRI